MKKIEFSNKNFYYLYQCLSIRRKKQIFILLFLMIFTSLTEVISIGSIYPFLTIIFSESANNNNLFNSLPFNLKFNLSKDFLLIFFLFMVLLAGLMRMLLLIFQTSLSHKIGIDFGKISISKTLSQPYDVQINTNRGELISIISNKISDTVNYVLITLLTILSTSITLVFICAFLFFLNLKISLIALSLFTIFYLVTVFLVKNRIYNNGVIWSNNQVYVLNVLREALNSIRELKIFKLESFYVKDFTNKYSQLRIAQAENQILSLIPKNLIEFFSISVFSIFILYQSRNVNNISFIIPLVGTFGMAASRLLPSAQNLYRSWSNLQSGKKILKDVLNVITQPEIKSKKTKKSKKIIFNKSIELKNITFSHDPNKKILDNINIKIYKNTLNCIIGKSGSGKSTLVDIISTLLEPNSGYIKIDNKILDKKYAHRWTESISYLSQDFFIKNATIAENIAYGIPYNQINSKKLEKAARKANIDNFINGLQDGYFTNIGEKGVKVSGGERQRIALARAYYRDSDLLILDEFTSALDKKNATDIIQNLSSEKNQLTIILITHDKSLLKYCDNVYEIRSLNIKKIK